MLTDSSTSHPRFSLTERVGGGASGDIFKAIDAETDTVIAVKLLRTTANSEERVRFERESEVLSALQHPNIVHYIAHGTWPDGRLFLAMEWLEGEDLSKRQRRAPLGTRDAVEVVRRAAQALAAVHARDVVHRDLKLSNIFLRGRGASKVKLIDFGIVRPERTQSADGIDERPTEPGTILGTPHYMAPEQARGEAVDPRADVYSLGSVLFRLLTGRNVFESDHVIALLGRLVLEDPPRPSAFRFDIPKALDDVVHRALSRDRGERYPHAGEFARALARVGELNNNPPQNEGSASAVRPRSRSKEDTNTNTGTATRPSLRSRRVVACLLVDAAEHAPGKRHPEVALKDIGGEDVRIEKLAGGSVVGVLGVEVSRGDEVMRAARAAMQLICEFPGTSVVVCNGHALTARSNLAGEALERAAEQLKHAKPGLVRLDPRAAAALELRFDIERDADGGNLLREDPRDLGPRNVLGRPTPTVGRERDITLAQTIYDEVLRDSYPRALVVTGAVGIGKSRMRSELLQRMELAPVPPEVLTCRCGSVQREGSVSALGQALRGLMGVQDGAPLDEQVLRVQRFVRSRLPRSLHFLSAFVGELIGVPFPDASDEPLRAARANEHLMQSRIRMALEAYFRTQSGRLPQVIVLEDADRADAMTTQLLEWLLACNDLRLTVLAFGKMGPVMQGVWPNSPVTRHELKPLEFKDSLRVVQTALPDATERDQAAIAQRSEGNPYVLEELIRHRADGSEDLPVTVQALMQRRLDRLPREVREAVRAAAVFGDAFWTGGVSALLDRDVTDDLAVAEQAEIAVKNPVSRVAGQTEWYFRQALFREAAATSLLEEDSTSLHLAAGDWLDSAGSVDLGLIARHYELGNEHERAATLYARATQQALANFGQLDAALELAERGLRCGAMGGERAQLLITKAHVSQRMGDLKLAIEAAGAARLLVPAGSAMWLAATRTLAGSLIESGRPTEGDDAIRDALEDTELNTNQAARAALLATRVRGLIELNQPTEALAVAKEARRHAADAGRRGEAALRDVLDAQLIALMTSGDPAAAVAVGYEFIEAADRAGDVHLASRARVNTASSFNYLGQFETAIQLLEQALPHVRHSRLGLLEASAIHNLGMSYARLGRLDEGVEMQNRATTLADSLGQPRIGINARCYEATMLVWRGHPGDLRRAHELSERLIADTSEHLALRVVAQFATANVQLARRQLPDALVAATSAYEALMAGPVEEWDEYIRLLYVQCLLSQGQQQRADEALATAFQTISARVSKMQNRAFAQSFVERNQEIALLLTLANSRLGLSPAD